MDPATLRYQILLAIEQHEDNGGDGHYLEDTRLAEATGASLRDVQKQLEILEHCSSTGNPARKRLRSVEDSDAPAPQL